MSTSRLFPRLAVLAAILATVAPISATSIIPYTDAELVDSAPLILVAHSEGPLAWSRREGWTDTLFTVERVLKGTYLPGSIVVGVPGGRVLTGDVAIVPGAPHFPRGTRHLLFLRAPSDEATTLLSFVQGSFRLLKIRGQLAAVRDMSGVQVVGSRGRGSRPMQIRKSEAFQRWIEDRAAGTVRPRDYLYKPRASDNRAITAAFTLLPDFYCGTGLYTRWSNFDSRGHVSWQNSGGVPGLAGGGEAEFRRALGAWNSEPTTPVSLRYTNATGTGGGAFAPDGRNVILFGDPFGEVEDIDQTLCKGTLGLGVPKGVPCSQVTFNGRKWIRIREADIVINNGLDCFFSRSPNISKLFEELFAHELGHTLGLGHSSMNESEANTALRDALMYFNLHDDGRGAGLKGDDVQALKTLYQKSNIPPPGPGSCPLDTLCLLNGRFRVTATWQNQFSGASGVAHVPRQNRALPSSFYNLSGFLYFDDPNNIELIVKVLDFGSQIKVFYGQLTNLRFTISVLDTRTGQTKNYTNTAGDCGGFDDAGFPSGAISTIMKPGSPRPRVGRSVRGTCRADADTMCLLNDRFQVEMIWRNQFNSSSGIGIPTRLSDLTGAMAFTDRANLETLVKVLEFPDRFLVLYGALSNLEFTLTIRDTVTGAVETYNNPAGRYCGGLDNDAF